MLTAAPSPSAAAAPFEQMQRLGSAVDTAGSQLAKIAVDRQVEANKVAITEAVSRARDEANRLAYDKDAGFTTQKGGAVLPNQRESGKPLAIEYTEEFNKSLQSIESTLANDAQKLAFREQGLGLMTSFRSSATQHETHEARAYSASVYEGSLKSRLQSISSNYNKPDVLASELGGMADDVRSLGKLAGKSGSEIDVDIREVQSRAIAGAVGMALEEGDNSFATKLYETYKDKLTGEVRLKLDGVITDKVETDAAYAAVSGVMGGAVAAGDSILPVRGARPIEGGRKTGDFGDKRQGHIHNGEDWAVPVGTSVRAQMDGEVVDVWEDGDNGKAVRVRYKDGSVHGFAHLSEQGVKKGDPISAGEVIAKTGSTGRSSGPHLHWTVTVGGQKIAPSSWKGGKAASTPSMAHTSLESVIDAAKRRAVAQGIEITASLHDKIVRQATQAWSIQEQSRKDREDAALDSALRVIDRNGGNWDAVPQSVKNALSPRDSLNVQNIADSVFKRRTEGRDTHDPVAWAEFINKNPNELAGMSVADFTRTYRGKLDDSHFEKGAAIIAAARGENTGGGTGILSTGELLKTRAREMGILPAEGGKPTEEQGAAFGRFAGNVDRRVADYERTTLQGKRKASRDEVEAIMAQTISDVVFVDRWGRDGPARPISTLSEDEIGNAYVKVDDAEVKIAKIPVGERTQIIEALRANNIPVTEQAIAGLYIKKMRNQR
jgi:murein DD-endopeptidase MepM/ murein hydrolase activator NlpD